MSPGKREDDEAPSDNILPYLNTLDWAKQNLCNFYALHRKWQMVINQLMPKLCCSCVTKLVDPLTF